LAVFAARPDRYVLSRPIAGIADDTVLRTFSYESVSGLRRRFRSASWSTLLARVALTEDEQRTWRGLNAAPRRSDEWVLGRVVLKDAVRSWLARFHDVVIGPRAIAIATTPDGAPHVDHIVGFDRCDPPAVSLAHDPTTIVAAAGPAGYGLGVDVEARDRPVASLARALDDHERHIVDSASRGVIEALVAKEAASKALGVGLGGSLGRWPIRGFRAGPVPALLVEPPDGHGGQVTVELLTVGRNVVGVARCEPHH